MKTNDDEELAFRVNILRVGEGNDKHCVEVIKESGDRFAFDEIYRNIRDFFGGYVNTKE